MKYLIISYFLITSTISSAQLTGMITYEEKVDIHKNLPPDRQQFKDMIPQFNTSPYELIFSGEESIYRAQKQEELPPDQMGSSRGYMSMRFGRGNRVVYKNLDQDTMIDSRDFMQKQFLITGTPTARKWKIGTKQKEILGYNCMEASFREDSTTAYVVWFTPLLQVSNGPADYQGLPGMILQVDVNEGERTFTATAITLDSVDTSVLVAPDKGKEVTAEEFEEIRREKMKEMGMQGGGPGGGQQMFIMRQ